MVSAGFKTLGKNDGGHNCPFTYYCSTAPTAISEALVMTLVGASEVGWKRTEALARACLILVKAVVSSSVHAGMLDGRFVCLRREFRGWIVVAQFGIVT